MKTLRAYHVFALTLIAIVNLREYPVLASMGWHVIWYTGIAFIGFLLPSAWICAQLVAYFPEQGGMYTWFREAFGLRWGRLGMSMEWLTNMISFPATCAVVIATILSGIWPAWQPSLWLTVLLKLALCWSCVFFCCRGLTTTHRISAWAALLGVMLPTVLIIVLGAIWVVTGHGIAWRGVNSVPSSVTGWEWGVLVSVFSAYAGMQASTFFAPQVESPSRTYPLALLSCATVIVCITTAAGLAMAAVMPASALNYVDGVVMCFQQFLLAFHLSRYLDFLVFLMVLGAVAALCTWMQALSRGVYQMALEGQWPQFFSQANAHQVAVRVLVFQGVVVSGLIGVLLCIADAQTAFWLMVLLTSQMTVILYMALFLAGMKLLIPHQSNSQRCATVVSSIVGICSSCLGLLASFWKPAHIVWTQSFYVEIVLLCDLLLVGMCVIWFFMPRMKWPHAWVSS